MEEKTIKQQSFSLSTRGRILTGLEYAALSMLAGLLVQIFLSLIMTEKSGNMELLISHNIIMYYGVIIGLGFGLISKHSFWLWRFFPLSKKGLQRLIKQEKNTLEFVELVVGHKNKEVLDREKKIRELKKYLKNEN